MQNYRYVALAAATAAFSIGLAPAAYAHDAVVNAWPGDNATVAEFPEELKIEFSGEIKKDFNTFALSRVSDQEVLFSGEPTVDGRFATLDLPDDLDAQPGEYRIGFQIISSDGHSTKGMTTFTYAAEGADAAQDQTQGPLPIDDEPGSSWTWLIVLGGVLVIAGAAVAMLGRMNQREKFMEHHDEYREHAEDRVEDDDSVPLRESEEENPPSKEI